MDIIRRLRVRAVQVPMAEPHRTASGVIAASPLVLLDLETTGGVTGRGLAFTYSPAALKPVADFAAALAPLVEGKPLVPEALTRELLGRFRLLGAHGLVGMAIAALDMAAWDALAIGRGLPLHALLGANARPTPAYGGVGFDGEAGSARAAEHWAKRGLRGVKAKIGYATVAEDVAVVRAMRSAVGPGIAIMVDYNQSLGVDQAIARLRVLDGEGLAWVEEPVQAEDYAGMAAVAREARTPVQAGENWWGPLEFAKAIAAGASDLLMPDLMKGQGVTGWLAIAATGAERSLGISSHLFPEVSAQVLAATPTAQWLEYADWWNPVLAAPLELRSGLAIPSERPGSGIAWDEAAVARFAA